MISHAVTMQLICAFVLAYAKSRFSHDVTQIMVLGSFCVCIQEIDQTSLFAYVEKFFKEIPALSLFPNFDQSDIALYSRT